MSEPKRCDKDGMCVFLEARITVSGKGFRSLDTVNIDPKYQAHSRWRGVSYHSSANDRGLLINFCPWCGGKPGDLANRDTPNIMICGSKGN